MPIPQATLETTLSLVSATSGTVQSAVGLLISGIADALDADSGGDASRRANASLVRAMGARAAIAINALPAA